MMTMNAIFKEDLIKISSFKKRNSFEIFEF